LASDSLLRVLRDPDPGVRWQAARALGTVGKAEALPFLTPLLTDTTEVFGRTIAETARSTIGMIEQRVKAEEQARRVH